MQRNQLVDTIYIYKSNKITKRRIKLITVSENSFSAYTRYTERERGCMALIEIFDLVHRQVILDLTTRTIERDRKHLNVLKLNRVLVMRMNLKIKEL